ncbi:hypothetical protein C0966_15855 [Bacillus methanolicus]|uniref:DUF1653 domain-containing protein n=1 Tax=Bacillus methanolicus TaxID=1471 RepID=UPI002380A9E1|nr:DUF1653 domain-containing protein [Bacillus methanolicus]MDE3840752.1 hypothetical protein [Bacillus methanolicus]
MKKYRHFKGNIYEFICIAIHSETGEKLVIYKDDKGKIFARPYEMFFDEVEHEGKLVPRFESATLNWTKKLRSGRLTIQSGYTANKRKRSHTSNFTRRGGYASLFGKPDVFIIWFPGWESMPVEAPCQVAVVTHYIWKSTSSHSVNGGAPI